MSGMLDNTLELWRFGIAFQAKPVVVGGFAMEYYGLRKRGDDIDLIICNDDYQVLAEKFPKHRKDMWADLGISVHGYELFRSIWKFDYDFFASGATEFGQCKVISFDKLFLMKVLAMNAAEKHKNDVDLILERYKRDQNPEYKKNMDDHIEKYLAAPGGVIYHDEY